MIEISSTFPFLHEVSGGNQFPNNSLSPTFSDLQRRRDVSNADSLITRNQKQRISVIGQ
jgi:hypothetical protein